MAAAAGLATTTTADGAVKRLKGGYRLEIFDKKEDQMKFSCGFCNKILREPLQATCGHRYCQTCRKALEESIEKGQKIFCKFCKDEDVPDEESEVIPSKMFTDNGIKREMSNVQTKCPNDLCVWRGVFKDYMKHEDECKHQPMICEKCGEPVSKQKMNQHKDRECPQRLITCQYCKSEFVLAKETAHMKECPMVPEPCSQCSRNIPREQMKKHKSQECPNRTVSCPIEGCSGPQQQGRFLAHVQKDQPKHLAWVLSRIEDIDKSLAFLLDPAAFGAVEGSGHICLQDVDNLSKKMEELEERLQKHMQQSEPPMEGAVGGLSEDGSGAQASGKSKPGNADRVNAMELRVNSLEPILTVLHGEMSRCIMAIETLEQKLMQEATKWQELQEKVDRFESTANAMTQREDKTREMEALLRDGPDRMDGTLLWRIPNFSKIRREAVAGTVTNIHSRPFYTGPIGYKMCVRLYANGDGTGKGSHLSLFFTLMRGNNDALMPWPFKQKVYFMLIDQSYKKHVVDAFRSQPSSSSFQRPTSEMNIATGCPLFVQLDNLAQPGHEYIKDDTIYIRVVVETEGLDAHMKQFDPRNTQVKPGPTS